MENIVRKLSHTEIPPMPKLVEEDTYSNLFWDLVNQRVPKEELITASYLFKLYFNALLEGRKNKLETMSLMMQRADAAFHKINQETELSILINSFRLPVLAFYCYKKNQFDDSLMMLQEAIKQDDELIQLDKTYNILASHQIQQIQNIIRIDLRKGNIRAGIDRFLQLINNLIMGKAITDIPTNININHASKEQNSLAFFIVTATFYDILHLLLAKNNYEEIRHYITMFVESIDFEYLVTIKEFHALVNTLKILGHIIASDTYSEGEYLYEIENSLDFDNVGIGLILLMLQLKNASSCNSSALEQLLLKLNLRQSARHILTNNNLSNLPSQNVSVHSSI